MNEVTNAMREFLDELRDEGSINMLSAGPYLETEFDLSKRDAREVLMNWIKGE